MSQDVALVDADLGVVISGIEELRVKAVRRRGDPSKRPCLRESFPAGKQLRDCWCRSKGNRASDLGMTRGVKCFGEIGAIP